MDSQGHVVSPDLNLYRYNGKDRYTGEIHGIPCLLDENLEIIQQFPDLDWIYRRCLCLFYQTAYVPGTGS